MYSDHKVPKYPVSIKGIICNDQKLLLRKNERDEWELLGGKLEINEDPKSCLVREIKEEAGLDVKPKSLIDVWVYHITPEIDVVVVTYACDIQPGDQTVRKGIEESELEWFPIFEIEALNMPEGYKKSIREVASYV